MSHPTAVVGVDGSPESLAALRWAVRFASAERVHAVAAWLPQPTAFGVGVQTPTTANVLLDDAERAMRRRLANAVETCSRDLGLPDGAISQHVEFDDPSTVLLRASAGADLLVLGNARRGRLAETLLGSVASSCLHHATCPVVLVPAPDDDAEDRAGRR